MSVNTEILKLRLYCYSYREISEVLDIDVDTVRRAIKAELERIQMAEGNIKVKLGGDDNLREILTRMVTAIERLADAAQVLVEKLEEDTKDVPGN